jgi:hypothetical protein
VTHTRTKSTAILGITGEPDCAHTLLYLSVTTYIFLQSYRNTLLEFIVWHPLTAFKVMHGTEMSQGIIVTGVPYFKIAQET